MGFPLSLLFMFVCHILIAASQMVHMFRNVSAQYVESSVRFRSVFLLVEHFCIRWMVLGVTLILYNINKSACTIIEFD